MTKMMKKKNAKTIYRKSVQLLAAAAVSAALLGTQAPYVFAGNDTAVEASSVIPDNVTIDQPVALSEIALPGNEYGTLSWADESFVPTKRVQSCEVILQPAGSADLSHVSGWDAESGVVTGYITVVVSSISEETPTETPDEPENTQPEITVAPDASTVPQVTVTPGASAAPQATVTPGAEGDNGVPGTADGITQTPTPGENTSGEEGKDPAVTPEGEGENPEDLPAAGQIGADEVMDTADGEQKQEDIGASDKVENIFDRPQVEVQEDTRPVTVEENLTEEEKAERALLNHSCEGISVSGINLPWYVQFRVSNGDSYQFTNQTEAAIFQSFEFELWDLQNNTEYEIPDGEYISVTVPVKEGYEYSIEHLLDNGATETIIPSVEGDMMIFSTHSFSPFGIAGSKPMVGADIAEDGYKDPDDQLGEAQTSTSGQTSLTVTPGTAAQDSNTTGGSSEIKNDNKTKSTDTDTNSDTSKQGSSSKAVNTGDNTMIYPFIILIAAAVIIIGAVVVVKKRK